MNKEKMKQVFCKDCFYANHLGNTPYSSIVNECLAMGKEKKHPVYGVWLEYPNCEVVNKKIDESIDVNKSIFLHSIVFGTLAYKNSVKCFSFSNIDLVGNAKLVRKGNKDKIIL